MEEISEFLIFDKKNAPQSLQMIDRKNNEF